MNLRFLDPTGNDFPHDLDKIIPTSHGSSVCCAFNRHGTLLAIGCREGYINIWDFETLVEPAMKLLKHEICVTSVSWSRNGRKLLSSDMNGVLLLWNISTEEVLIHLQFSLLSSTFLSSTETIKEPTVKYPAFNNSTKFGIAHSWLHGRSSKLAMIHLSMNLPPMVVEFKRNNLQNNKKNGRIIIETLDNRQKSHKILVQNHSCIKYNVNVQCLQMFDYLSNKNLIITDAADDEMSVNSNSSNIALNSRKKHLKQKIECFVCAVFDKHAYHIFCGTNFGQLIIIDYARNKIVKKYQLTGNRQKIKSIVFSHCGKYILVNCGDRMIRYINIAYKKVLSTLAIEVECAVKKKYYETIERKQWSVCCFSTNSEYICAASAQKASCRIMIWQRCLDGLEGSLQTVLKGPDAQVIDIEWHPIYPILISITHCGEIQIWNKKCQEIGSNFSCFAREFQIITENVIYRESEDEDIQECKKLTKKRQTNAGKNENDIDINLLVEIKKRNMMDKEMNAVIDIFSMDKMCEDFFSDDETFDDFLDGVLDDSLIHELKYLPMHPLPYPYTRRQLTQIIIDEKNEYKLQMEQRMKEKKEKQNTKELEMKHEIQHKAHPKQKQMQREDVLRTAENENSANMENIGSNIIANNPLLMQFQPIIAPQMNNRNIGIFDNPARINSGGIFFQPPPKKKTKHAGNGSPYSDWD